MTGICAIAGCIGSTGSGGGVGIGGATVGASLAVSLNPAIQVSGFLDTGSVEDITTAAVLASAQGGVGALTYAWTQLGTSPYVWHINTPAAATTTFTCDDVGVGVSTQQLFQVKITDSLGNFGVATILAKAKNKTTLDDGGGTR
jgi:hypothetical protein